MLISDILKRNAKLFPSKISIVFGERWVSNDMFNARVNRLSNALLGKALEVGDRVAILMMNRLEYLECYFSCAKTGIAAIPINYRLSENEISYILSDSTPRGIIFEDKYQEFVGDLIKRHPNLEFAVCVGEIRPKWALNYEEWIHAASDAEIIDRIQPDDIMYIMYTSGTTGKPKGAMITHKNLIANSYTHCMETHLRTEDTFLTAAPLCLTGGVNKAIGSMLMGVTVHIEPNFELPRFVHRIIDFKVSHVFLVPAMIIFILDSAEVRGLDYSNLKMIMYGSAPMPLERLRESIELFGCDFLQTFGQTESSPVLTVLRPEDHVTEGHLIRRLTSAGRQAVGVEVRIFDDRDIGLPAGEVGEVVARGDNIMKGYWNLPSETSETLRGGWLHTGDLGRSDEDHYIYIVDRKKDLIISGGMNIYSKEVEDVISAHPDVLEAAVIGIPDEKWGESVKAFLVLRSERKVSETEIMNYCQERLASYKKPRSIVFLERLPRNTAGKVLKTELKRPFWKGQDRMVH